MGVRLKRAVYRVQWVASVRLWRIATGRMRSWSTFRDDAIEAAVSFAKARFRSGGLAQVVVHNKKGRIAFERTYGRDPKRRKG
jgi:uncharacterized protein DUF2188